MTIPKIIHYCWFGRNPLPVSAQKCIASWRKYLPDYEIKEWNEDNFDVNSIPYTKQAYEAKKYAFVSDYARFWILYHYGGLYFDTDVELINQDIKKVISRGPFMGQEKGAFMDGKQMVNPGLGLGVQANHSFYEQMLRVYHSLEFWGNNGIEKTTTIVTYTTKELYANGMKPSCDIQEVCGIWIYPVDYFCPMDSTTGIITLTDKTVSVHHYDCSWVNHDSLRYKLHQLKNLVYKVLGQRVAEVINKKIH